MGEKKISIKNLYLVSVICFGLVCLGVGSTYAIFTTQAEITNPIALSSNLSYDSSLMETISLTIGAKETITNTFNINNTSEENLNYIIYYIDEDLDVDFGTAVGNPTGTVATGASASVDVEIRNNTTSSVTIIMGILSGPGSVVLGSSMTAVSGEGIPPLLVEYISNLYMNNKDEDLVPNNNVEYRYASIYDKDTDSNTSGGLMNDRHGSMDVSEDAGNIRYYGAKPNNYIYFNCDDYSNQSSSTCETWRIIGVFEGKVKIMRGSPIGSYTWDDKKSGIGSSNDSSYGSNEWSDSRLMMLLNPGYDTDRFDTKNNLLNEHNRSYYWNSTGTSSMPVKCHYVFNTTNCYFNDKGLKNDITKDLISESLWYLRGWNSNSVFSNQIYEKERTTGTVVTSIARSTTWTGKIALPYPSDYGYAADFGSCNVVLGSYSNNLCTDANWMKSILAYSGCWLLTPSSSSSGAAWSVDAYYGKVVAGMIVANTNGVVPVLYLNSELSTGAGDGSQNTPYQLAVN